mgnify:CR=1 FL=1
MDFCDKCGEEISKLEPCFRVSYGFLNDDNSFFEDNSLRVHLDCLSDEIIIDKVLDKLDKH